MSRIPRQLEAVTGDDGIATLSVAPGSRVTISFSVGDDFEDDGTTRWVMC